MQAEEGRNEVKRWMNGLIKLQWQGKTRQKKVLQQWEYVEEKNKEEGTKGRYVNREK